MRLKQWTKAALAAVLSVSMVAGAAPITLSTASAAEPETEKGYVERLTPLMGWSSWNEFHAQITEKDFTDNMDLMKEYGLIDAGYEYFNIDDGYQGGRDEDGYVTWNTEKFPHGMKYIADYAHDLGMKAGIYTDLGIHTCASVSDGEGNSSHLGRPGTGYGLTVGLYGNEEKDLRHYFGDWGYDFIKVDYCGARDLGWNLSTMGTQQYNYVGDIIEQLRNEYGRDIIYNVCCWRFPGEEIVNGQADSWRTGGDLSANFNSIISQVDNIRSLAKYSKPGKVNDLDMLQVGREGLTNEENKTHFAMWCMASSPLLIGSDLRQISPQALEILKNEEVIALDQDPACIQASVAKTLTDFDDGDNSIVEFWRKDLGEANSTTKAIAILNRANVDREVTVSWKDMGFRGDVTVRDLWQHKYVNLNEGDTVTVPAHGTLVYKVEGDLATEIVDEKLSDPAEITVETTIEDKPTDMDLTALGNADWFHYLSNSNCTFRKKAGVESQLSVDTSTGSIPSSGYYYDSASYYSWTDGTPQTSASRVRGGLTISNTVGDWVQVNAASDSREHTLYVPITGWHSNVKIEVLADGKVVDTQTINGATWTDGAVRVNKLVTVKYSSDIPATVSVRWTIDGNAAGYDNGNIAIEAAALSIDGTANSAALYGSSSKSAANTADLAAEGTLDYVQFGGADGAVSLEKDGTDLLGSYTTREGAAVTSADTNGLTYTAGAASSQKGAAQSELESRFYFDLPAAKELTQAKIYFGAREAEVSMQAEYGSLKYSDSLVETDGGNYVMTLCYQSEKPVKAALRLVGTLGGNAQLRLDAITLAPCEDTVVFEPEVSQKDDTLSVSAEVLSKSDIKAKTLEVALYDAEGTAADTATAELEQIRKAKASIDLEMPVAFTGRAVIRVLDADGQPVGKSYEYTLPLAGRKSSGYVGRYTAKKMVKEGAVLVDVRSAEEFARGHIEGAINIPQGDILNKADGILSGLGATKDTNIIVYCSTGKRSSQSREILLGMGYTHVYDFGGYENWYLDPTVIFPDFLGMISAKEEITIDVSGTDHEVLDVKYSIGADSTIEDAQDYTGAFPIGESDTMETVVKAYLLFAGEVVYETSYTYDVFQSALPDLSGFTGVYLSDLTPLETQVGWSTWKNDKSADNGTMTIAGVQFPKGVSGHAPSYAIYQIPEGMNRFVAAAGCDDEVTGNSASKGALIHYSVYIDDEQVGETISMTPGKYYVFDIEIPKGSQQLKLVAKNGGPGNSYMHSEWGIAEFVNDPSYDISHATVSMDITFNNEPVQDATVKVYKKGSDQEIAPQEDGTYWLTPGEYEYTITKDRFMTVNGSFTVGDSEVKVIPIALEMDPSYQEENTSKKLLQAAVNAYSSMDTTAYTQESAAALAAALETAQAALDDGSEADPDDALAGLMAAASGLKIDLTGLSEDTAKAQKAAEAAQAAADAARKIADAAVTQENLTALDGAVKAAQTAAGSAKDIANEALNAAQQNAATIKTLQSTITTIQTAAETAQAAATAAQEIANSAKADAAGANEKADAAQAAANDAKAAADTASQLADTLKVQLEAAQKENTSHQEDLKKLEAEAAAAKAAAEEAQKAAQKAKEETLAAQTALEIMSFRINTPELKTAKSPKKKTLKVTWSVTEGAEGYEVLYGTKATFKKAKKAVLKKGTAKAKVIKKLKRGKKYYVKIRAYKTIAGQKVYTQYSAVKKVKVK